MTTPEAKVETKTETKSEAKTETAPVATASSATLNIHVQREKETIDASVAEKSTVSAILKAAKIEGKYSYIKVGENVYGLPMSPPLTDGCTVMPLVGNEGFTDSELALLQKWNKDQSGLTTGEWFWSWAGYTPDRFVTVPTAVKKT